MAGVYISYPFCGQKCTYCNFVSGVFAPAGDGFEEDQPECVHVAGRCHGATVDLFW